MKKIILFISPLIVGLFSGLVIECLLTCFSAIMSPFSTFVEYKLFLVCGGFSLVSALIIIAVVIADVRFLIELNNRKKLRLVLILQSCATIFICFVSWNYSVQIINYLYHLL